MRAMNLVAFRLKDTPFRGATADVGQNGPRCNFDLQFMPRAPVLADLVSAEKPKEAKDEDGKFNPASSGKKILTYDNAEAFYGIRLQLPADPLMRQAANSMVAMWQAAHNTDYYITKYNTKGLEQLQNLIGQFALGLRRLEVQEQQEIEEQGLSVELNDYKRRARKVTLRLAMAANRSTWVSCCEMALFILSLIHI